jgi:hypothetical protein
MKHSLPARPALPMLRASRLCPKFCMESAYAVSFGIPVPGSKSEGYRLPCGKAAQT